MPPAPKELNPISMEPLWDPYRTVGALAAVSWSDRGQEELVGVYCLFRHVLRSLASQVVPLTHDNL